ncbi:MAG: class I SAM-dependent methyltransferase [Nitrososphaera sp.]
MNCRNCGNTLEHIFADLGMSPLANSYLKEEELNRAELFYPLRAFVCDKCFLVQVEEFERPENIFSNYAYFSSYSETWLNHVKNFAVDAIKRFNLNSKNRIIEIASNDGYLLQYFKNQEISVLGIEPAVNVASVAIKKGIPTITKFFGVNTVKEIISNNIKADLLIAINVVPHVPNLHDFIDGMKLLLDQNGVIMIQFSAYLMRLIEQNEFDTIYHEHFSYFSLSTIQDVLSRHNLSIFDVEEVPIHGGSLRIYAKHSENNKIPIENNNIQRLLQKEKEFGLTTLEKYTSFAQKINKTKLDIWNFFIKSKLENKKIVCYGAPAKGNTLLNFCGIGQDLIDYTVDINPHKQSLYLPGTHIRIFSPEKIRELKPDYIIILPWNLKEEIIEQMKYIREWNGKFVILIPAVTIFS